MEFRWNEWNVEHLARHGVDPETAEAVALGTSRRYPRRVGDDKLLVWGEGPEGELLQVVYVLDDDGTAFVLHARPLTPREKRLHRRQGRR